MSGLLDSGNGAQQDSVHEATSRDGTKIVGRVQGQGQPLVLVHGGLGNGETSWLFMLPFLVDHFTCYMMSTRGRGLSEDNPDHTRERHCEDIATFIEAIGQPVGVFGHSAGAFLVLGGAALAAQHVSRVALYEPPLPLTRPFMTDEQHAQMGAAVSENRTADFIHLAIEAIGLNEDEEAMFSQPLALQIAEPNIPAALLESRELNRAIDDATIAELSMPVLLIQGALSGGHFKEAIAHLAARIDNSRVVEITGAGHMGPLTAAESVAQELVGFFSD